MQPRSGCTVQGNVSVLQVLGVSARGRHRPAATTEHVAGSDVPRTPAFSLSFMETGPVAGHRQLTFSFRWEWWGGGVARSRVKEDLVLINIYIFLIGSLKVSAM